MSLHAALHQLKLAHRGIVPWPGLIRSVAHFVVAYLFVYYLLTHSIDLLWVVVAIISGVLYASLLVLTHDALHFTLTGWRVFDDLFSRLVSYPILWPILTYGELHRLHHKYNGNNSIDPENVMATRAEWERGSASFRFYRRYQWWINLFLSGGLGHIYHHWTVAKRDSGNKPRLRRAMRIDLISIVTWHVAQVALFISMGIFLRWLVMFFIMERIIGFVHQLRALVEHYGVWNPKADPLETQVYSCQNIRTSWWASQYMNGLNYHSVHHAFPTVPFYKLRQVHIAMKKVCEENNSPLHFTDGYLRTAWKMSKSPRFIES